MLLDKIHQKYNDKNQRISIINSSLNFLSFVQQSIQRSGAMPTLSKKLKHHHDLQLFSIIQIGLSQRMSTDDHLGMATPPIQQISCSEASILSKLASRLQYTAQGLTASQPETCKGES
jgi:hypothetical protein